jgi:hypothetical protein
MEALRGGGHGSGATMDYSTFLDVPVLHTMSDYGQCNILFFTMLVLSMR